MSCVGILQARSASTRLPAKVLAELGGRPLLGLLLDRLRRDPESGVSEWWVATTVLPEDDDLCRVAERHGARVYRGDPDDVSERFAAIAALRGPEWVLRGTGDNPFVDSALVSRLLAAADAHDGVDLWTQPGAALPLGYGMQLARTTSFLASLDEIPDAEPFHRAHVMSWLSAKGVVREFSLPSRWPVRPHWRWTVDTERDLRAARAVVARCADPLADYPAMARCLDAAPEVMAINRAERQRRPEEG